jgi:hypothetical protein
MQCITHHKGMYLYDRHTTTGGMMRLTIETTSYPRQYQRKVIVEQPADDLDLHDMFALFADALEGMGFTGARKYLEGD